MNKSHLTKSFLLLLAMLCLCSASAFGAARIVVINTNAPGIGFNDPTPAQPVGGNPGTTIGQQRLIAYQYAADIWGANLDSTVEIRVQASFTPLACTANTAVLGSARAANGFANFSGAEFGRTFYHVALANKRAARDLDPANDDIITNFNSELGRPGCLEGGGFYYGLDGRPPAGQSSLITVLLHEFAHGLGFSTFTNTANGVRPSNFDDVYMRHLFDNTIGKNWTQMTNAERAASAINTRNVVWIGANVLAAVPQVLRGRPFLRVNTPPDIAGTYEIGTASFGAPLTNQGITGNAALVDDGVAPVTDGCQPIVNTGAINGNIAVIDRGTCAFAVKAKIAQDAGAIGVIIVNNAAGVAPGLAGADPTVTIPVVSVSQADGNRIKSALASNIVNVTIALDPNRLSGADENRRPYIYTPNPREPGSSVSHWDTSLTPNQLMEPAINSDLTLSVKPPEDLTLPAFRDEGWFVDADGDNLPDGVDTSSRIKIGSTVTRDCQTGEYLANVTIFNIGTGIANNVQIRIASLGSADASNLPLLFGTINAGSSVTQTIRFPSSAGQPGARVQLDIIGTKTTTFLDGNFSTTSTKLLPGCQ